LIVVHLTLNESGRLDADSKTEPRCHIHWTLT